LIGDTYLDLGFPNPEEASSILRLITDRKLTQKKAGSFSVLTSPRFLPLLRGKLAGFSTERLLRFINTLGQDVEIVSVPRATTLHQRGLSSRQEFGYPLNRRDDLVRLLIRMTLRQGSAHGLHVFLCSGSNRRR
jgi:predicted XRE-type DNA-binding protein